jgi:hypothetical protein
LASTATFHQNEVEADVLPDLTEADLEKNGLPLGLRKRILKAPAPLGAPPPSLQRARALLSEPKRRRYRAGVRPVLRRKRRPKKLVSS